MRKTVYLLAGVGLLVILLSVTLYIYWRPAADPSPDALALGRRQGTTLTAHDCFELALSQGAQCRERSILERRDCLADAGGFGKECVLQSRRRLDWCNGLRPEQPTASATLLCETSSAMGEFCPEVAERTIGGCVDLPDVSSCEKENSRERCVADIAATSNDPRACEALKRDQDVARCLELASAELGPRACDLIDDPDRARNCFSVYSQHADSVTDCKEISFPAQVATCITSLSYKAKDPSLCSKQAVPMQQAKCYQEAAKREKNPRLCASISLVHLRDECFRSFRECSQIEGQAMKRRCQLDLARGTVELCATATTELDKAAQCVRGGIAYISKSRVVTPEECGNLEGFLREVCITEVAVSQKTRTGCDGLNREFDRADCISRVAAATGDSRMCWSLAPRFRAHCLATLTNNDDPMLCDYAANAAVAAACRRAAENVRSR